MPTITICNKRDRNFPKGGEGILQNNSMMYFSIDRTTPVGNPFPMRRETDRDRVCDQYQYFFEQRMADKTDHVFHAYIAQIAAAYRAGHDVLLFCWCAPKRCHGETIRNYILKGE